MKFKKKLIVTCLTTCLAACGGEGGSSDGSTPDTPDPEPANTAPVSDAGSDQAVEVGGTVNLDASASSDADGDSLTYSWSFDSLPEGSEAVLQNAGTESASFTADIAGEYLLLLTVNDGQATDTDRVTIEATAGQASSTADFYTPAPIVDALALTRDVSWAEYTAVPGDLGRFVFGPADSSDILVLNDDNHQVAASLEIASGTASLGAVSDEILLKGMFKLIAESDDSYRIVSTKHSNYTLDIADAGDDVILRDYRSGSKDENTAGYLVFEFVGSSHMTLTAVGRKKYDTESQAYVNDLTFYSRNLALTDGALVMTTGAGTAMHLYRPPIDFSIPFDFNPDEIERVSNEEVTPAIKGNDLSDTPMQVVDEYAAQVSSEGDSVDTRAAAEAMLDEIEVSLLDEGAGLRYSKSFYLTLRDGLFTRVYESSDSTDGDLGRLTVPYVLFTNETDDEGDHHPFMVIASYGLPDTLTLLWDVPKPSGDGGTEDYNTQKVTRSIHRETLLMKIPLRDYGEVENLTENKMNNDLASDLGISEFDHHNYASISATGVAVDGVLIYPSYNNALHVSQADAELSAHGMHSGRGLGAHYHADAHSARAEGLNLYNDSDYVGHSHPPIVSIGFDGVAGYGIYRAEDSEMDGATLALDGFGGHEHGDYGYHYHSYAIDAVTEAGAGPGDPAGGVSYKAHQLPPFGAWAGRINDIPEFWDGTAPNYVGGKSRYLGTEE